MLAAHATSHAEQRAERDGLAVVAVLTPELVNVAQGHPMIVRTLDGTEVLLRLMTPVEVQAAERDARDSLTALGIPYNTELMSEERAAELVRPLPECR